MIKVLRSWSRQPTVESLMTWSPWWRASSSRGDGCHGNRHAPCGFSRHAPFLCQTPPCVIFLACCKKGLSSRWETGDRVTSRGFPLCILMPQLCLCCLMFISVYQWRYNVKKKLIRVPYLKIRYSQHLFNELSYPSSGSGNFLLGSESGWIIV